MTAKNVSRDSDVGTVSESPVTTGNSTASSDTAATVILYPETEVSGIADSLRSLELQTLGPESLQILVCAAEYEADDRELAGALVPFSSHSAVIPADSEKRVEQLNAALSKTRGRYVTWLAAGDWFPQTYLSDMFELADSTGAEICVANHLEVDGFRRVLKYAPLGRRRTAIAGRSLIPPVEYSTLVDQLAPKLTFASTRAIRSARLAFDEQLETGYVSLWAWQVLLAGLTVTTDDFPGPCVRAENGVRPRITDRDMVLLCRSVLEYSDTMILSERAKALRLAFDWVLRMSSDDRSIDQQTRAELRNRIRGFSTDTQAAALLSLKEDPRKTIAEFIGAGTQSWPR